MNPIAQLTRPGAAAVDDIGTTEIVVQEATPEMWRVVSEAGTAPGFSSHIEIVKSVKEEVKWASWQG